MKRALFAALFFLLPLAARADTAQDIVTGTNSPGPFALSWNGVAPGTDTVQIGSLPQTRGLDYTLDADAGTISFKRPLPAGAIASVRYDYDPKRAVRVGTQSVIPLAVDLARAGQSTLALSARLVTGSDPNNPAPGTLTVGAHAEAGSRDARLHGQVNYAPSLSAQGGPGTSDASRTSVGVGAHVGKDGGPLSLAADFARAGQNAAPDASQTVGAQTVTVRASVSPAQSLSAQGQWTQTAPLTGDQTGPATTQTGASVTLAPAARASISVSADTADAPGTASDTQAITVRAAASPVPILSLTAESADAQRGDTTSARRAASATLSPSGAMSVTAGAVQTQSAQSRFTLTTLGGTVRMGRALELSGAWRDRTASPSDRNPADALDTGVARLALSPVAGLKLVGTLAQNPDGGSDYARALSQNGLGVEAGVGALTVAGDWAASRDGGTLFQQSLSVRMGLRLSALTQVSGSLTQTLAGQDGSAAGTNLYTLGLSHALGDRFSLSLSGTAQAPTGLSVPASPDYTARAALGLRF